MKIEARIARYVGRAIANYRMIDDGDRVLLAVSGGKDSLCLLNILLRLQRRAPVKFEIIPVHVVTDNANAAVIENYVTARGVPLIRTKPGNAHKNAIAQKSPCFSCSWQRRDGLFKTARTLGCRKIALAHHKDDIVQTMLLNLFFLGEISTMSPRLELFNGDIHIIRPLAYVEESLVEEYARMAGLPSMPRSCAHGNTNKRALMKDIICQLEPETQDVRTNIFRALQRVKKNYLL